MNKSLVKKISFLIFFVVIFRIFIIAGLNYTNLNISNYIYIKNNVVTLEKPLDSHLYSIIGPTLTNNNMKTYQIKSKSNMGFDLLIDNLEFFHKIYINNDLVSQNTGKSQLNYDNDYAYKVIKIKPVDYINHIVKIKVEGKRASGINVFIAKSDVMQNNLELRTILNVILLISLMFCTIISLVLYLYHLKDFYFILFVAMGIVSVIKSVEMGELFIIVRLLGINVGHFLFIGRTTTIINTILPFLIIISLFNIKIKPKFYILGLAVLSILSYEILKTSENVKLYYIMFTIMSIANVILLIYGFLKNKPYSKVILINQIIYSSLVFYHLMVIRNFQNGSLIFFINPSYLGAVIYMSGFLFAAFMKHLDKLKELDENRKEYERVSILKGLSHDLKLPLSILKLNNQMILNYKLSDDEVKEYANRNLKANLELEKMIDNINGYLNIKSIDVYGITPSIKEYFNDLENKYSFYNKQKKRLNIKHDNNDCSINLSSLNLDRIFYNLIDNAFKHNKENCKVIISYKIYDEVIITVEDTGIGITKDKIEKSFEPFYRIDSSRSKSGLGLGLSVVKGIISRVGGTINVESEIGKGTKYIITLPVK